MKCDTFNIKTTLLRCGYIGNWFQNHMSRTLEASHHIAVIIRNESSSESLIESKCESCIAYLKTAKVGRKLEIFSAESLKAKSFQGTLWIEMKHWLADYC